MKKLINTILEFRDERDWQQFHNPKDLAIALSIESSELLENFLWKSSEEAVEQNENNIKDEISDVMIYSILLANRLNIDIEEAIQNKIESNKKKYPIEKCFGSSKKYIEYID